MSVCEVPGCESHYGCRLRAKGIQVDSKIHAKQSSKPPVFRNARSDSFESAPARDERGVPLIRPNRTPVSLGEVIPHRRNIATATATKSMAVIPERS